MSIYDFIGKTIQVPYTLEDMKLVKDIMGNDRVRFFIKRKFDGVSINFLYEGMMRICANPKELKEWKIGDEIMIIFDFLRVYDKECTLRNKRMQTIVDISILEKLFNYVENS